MNNPDNNEITPLGKALLVFGGVILAGTILSAWTEDEEKETAAESLPFVKSRSNTLTKRKSEKIFKVKVDDKPKTRNRSVVVKTLSQNPTNGERKYPDFYYSMSKGQQYKYRLKNRLESD